MSDFFFLVNWQQMAEEMKLSDEAVLLLTERDHTIEDYLNNISAQVTHASILKFGQ